MTLPSVAVGLSVDDGHGLFGVKSVKTRLCSTASCISYLAGFKLLYW